MKLIMDERVKHRVVGLAVILSIGAIFMPAIMKKSNQRFDKGINMTVKLPVKPPLPTVAIPQKKVLFEKVKVAQVDLPTVHEELKPLVTVAKAQPLHKVAETKIQVVLAKIPELKGPQPQPLKMAKVVKSIQKPLVLAKAVSPLSKPKSPAGKARYGVQLALFSQRQNAVSLINHLKKKGYKANFTKVMAKDEIAYKVIVGSLQEKQQALVLKQQLASAVKINGFVVPTVGVS